MQKKVLTYLAGIIALVLLGYNSVYFKKLDQVKAASTTKGFDAPRYARRFLDKKLPSSLEKAIDIDTLLQLVRKDPQAAFQNYSHALGIGNIRYFLVKGDGVITALDENAAVVALRNNPSQKIRIATEFVYGNALRDASGLININEFNSTMDFNNVSAEMNKIIRTEVIPPFRAAARTGDSLKFWGAIELNRAHTKLDDIEVAPAKLDLGKQAY